MKISLKDIKRLLAPCSDAISLSICYAILLVLACSVFRKPTQVHRGFELFFHSALIGIDYDEFIMNAFGSRSTSVGQLQKYAARAKLFVF